MSPLKIEAMPSWTTAGRNVMAVSSIGPILLDSGRPMPKTARKLYQ